jgi:YD repeat-containing protein
MWDCLWPRSSLLAVIYLTQSEFDDYGRITKVTDRNGVIVTNAYDILGRITNRTVLAIGGIPAFGANDKRVGNCQ